MTFKQCDFVVDVELGGVSISLDRWRLLSRLLLVSIDQRGVLLIKRFVSYSGWTCTLPLIVFVHVDSFNFYIGRWVTVVLVDSFNKFILHQLVLILLLLIFTSLYQTCILRIEGEVLDFLLRIIIVQVFQILFTARLRLISKIIGQIFVLCHHVLVFLR